MTTNYAPAAAGTPSARELYKGRDKSRPIGQILRGYVRDGRAVTREQTMRWQESREFYRGNQWVSTNNTERMLTQLSRNLPVPSGRAGYNAYNRLRQFTDGRVALLTKERPPYEVIPEDNDADSIDAARQAEKFLAAKWGRSGWNVKTRLAELAKNGDIDGISWLYVDWDAEDGKPANQLTAVFNGGERDGQPVTDRNDFEALKAQDPDMQSLWRMDRAEKPVGDVCWRVVLPGALSVDPFAIKSFDEARWIIESRIRPRDEVEERLGMSFKDAVREYAKSTGTTSSVDVQYEDLVVDDGGTASGKISESLGVVVHYFYAKPSPDWPRGACIEFCDKAPDRPLRVAECDELPYFAYVPRPDPGHFMRSRSIVDDLKPIQRDYNQTLRDLRTWLKKMANMPVFIPRGGLVSDSLYNEDGYVETHPGLGEPHMMPTPSEPTAVLTNELMRIVSEMEKISGVSSYAQGFSSPGGPESNIAIQGQVQQTEQNLSEVEANFIEVIEWGCSRSLRLVKDNYTVPRTVIAQGVDDAEQFRAFTGSMLRGVDRMRINGPLMPKSKAMRMNQINAMAPMLGDKILPYIGGLIDGDPTELQSDVALDRQHQKGETRELVGLVTNPTAMAAFENFEEDKQAFAQALNAAAVMAQQMGTDPQTLLMGQGIQPPQLTRSLQEAGVELPLVEDFHNHALELKALDDFRKGDGYKNLHPMAKQLLREHADAHKAQMAQQLASMAQQQPMGQQQGSAPNPKGAPSPPKNATTPGGAP